MSLFEFDKTYVNPLYGRCSPAHDFPRLLNLYERGDFRLDEMVARAFDDMLAGSGAKRVLVFE